MRLIELLESLGDRLGIVEKTVGNASPAGSKIQTRSVTLEELKSEIRSEEVQALADLPAELAVPFEKIMETAGIEPGPHGWTIERLKALLLTDEFKNLKREEAQKRILGVLSSQKVSAEDLVRDAVARDRTIDAFERTARLKMENRMAVRERQIADIEAKITELEKETARLKEKASADQAKWREWRARKRALEKELAWSVAYLIEGQVITTDEDDG
jgi:predicted  nucleic acid-binding Zn-ribbon protein